MEDVKGLYVITDAEDRINNIIEAIHLKGVTDKKGKIYAKKKNLSKMYPKYCYIVHLILVEQKFNNKPYKHINRETLLGIIGERGHVASLMLDMLEDAGVIRTHTKHSYIFNKGGRVSGKSTAYEIGEDFKDSLVELKLFNVEENKFLRKIEEFQERVKRFDQENQEPAKTERVTFETPKPDDDQAVLQWLYDSNNVKRLYHKAQKKFELKELINASDDYSNEHALRLFRMLDAFVDSVAA